MKIFLTGASGFIGKNVARKLLENGHEVTVLLRIAKQKEKWEKLGAKIVISDLENINKSFPENIDAVFHLAAIRYEWGYFWTDYKRVNIDATKNLLMFSQRKGIKHFIFCSTVYVYGYPPKLPIDETFPYCPTTLYAKSKMEAEKILKENTEKNIKITILRPTIVYGPGDTNGMLFKLCHLINQKHFAIIGQGKNSLHLTHIDDLSCAFMAALESKKSLADYIIASEKSITFSGLVNLIGQKLQKEIWPIKIPLILARLLALISDVSYKIGQYFNIKYFSREPFISKSKLDILTKSLAFDGRKAQEDLNFRPKISCEEGVIQTIDWYKNNGYL